MTTMQDNHFTIVVQMLVWKPIAETFNAFIDPSITSKFWFARSSGPLEAGKTVNWEWEVNNISARVNVEEIIDGKLIKLDWGGPIPKLEIEFKTYGDHATLVIIRNYNEKIMAGKIINEIIENTSDLTSVLDGLKAYLEHNIKLNLIADKVPHHN